MNQTIDWQHLGYYEAKSRRWNSQAGILRGAQVCLGFVSIVCSVLASSKAIGDYPWLYPWLSATAAIAVALFTGLSVSQQANKLRAAWRELNCAIRAYKEGESTDIKTVREAYRKGEEIIGQYEPKPAGV